MSRLKSVTKSPHNTVPSPTPRHSSCLIFHPYLYYLTNAMQECEPLAPDCRIVQETVCGNAGYSPSDSPPPPPPHSRAHINQHYGLGKREAQASRQEKSYNKAEYQGFRYGPHLGPLGFGPLARLPVAPGGSDPWPGTTKDKVALALFSPCQVMAAPRYRDKSVNLRSQLAEKCLTKSANQQLRENVTLFPNLIAPKWQERFQEKNVALWKRSTASISRSRSARRFLNRNVSQ